MNNYNCKGIHYQSGKDDWKKIQKTNPAMALDMLKKRLKKNIYSGYISKQNSDHENKQFF